MAGLRFKLLVLLAACTLWLPAEAQLHRGARTLVRGGQFEKPDSLQRQRDSLRVAEIARQIALRVRHIGGGLHFVKALGIALEDRNQSQVSMNLTDYTRTSVYTAFEMVKMEARRYGVRVVGSEVVGIVPMQSLLDCAEYYLQIEDFSMDQVLESHL